MTVSGDIGETNLGEALGAKGAAFTATAVNDYAVEIPTTDAVEGAAIIVYLMDGAEMSLRDKGPPWMVSLDGSISGYQCDVVYSRSIWQLDRLVVAK